MTQRVVTEERIKWSQIILRWGSNSNDPSNTSRDRLNRLDLVIILIPVFGRNSFVTSYQMWLFRCLQR